MKSVVVAAAFQVSALPLAFSFSNTLFHEAPVHQRRAPSKHEGVDIELPDFDELFGRIQQVSPLANQVISRSERRGFDLIGSDPNSSPDLKWKTVESNKKGLLRSIEKIDNFQGHNAPLLRFRGTMEGPCEGELFANYIMELDMRKQWDTQINEVYEAYPINDLDSANIAMGFGKHGDCSRLGIGYCQTKKNLGIAPREQLTLCGLQDFNDGSSIVWGVEMEEWWDHLLPEGQRFPRAKSHIFSTTLTPTEGNKFDVEYVLQLEAGGNLPTWLTTPVMVESVKKLFKTADACYRGRGDTLENYLKEKQEKENRAFAYNPALLITP